MNVLYEPIDGPVPAPQPGGWPSILIRTELLGVKTTSQAAYEIAGLSRRMRIGLVADFDGTDMVAFPHLATGTIIEMWRFAKASKENPMPLAEPREEVERWTPIRKAEVVHAIENGSITFAHAMSHYGLSEEELDGWIASWSTGGVPALRVSVAR